MGHDPSVKYTGSGKAVTEFSVATSRTYSDSDGARQEKTSWHTVVCFGKQAESCGQYLAKGSQVAVEGSIDYQEYETRHGEKKTRTKILAERVKFLDRKPEGGS